MVILLSLILLNACGSERGVPKQYEPDHPHGCPNANPGHKPINIRYNGSTVEVAPKNKEVHQGDVIRFNLVYTGNHDSEPEVLVSVAGREAKDGWLNGSGKKKAGNAASSRFDICVPRDLFEGDPDEVLEKDYEYDVKAVGHEYLDPIVTVKRF
jgi:hypothetical protein